MASLLNPYLTFRGTAREALEFYTGVLGGDVQITTFGQFPGGAPEITDQVMHGQLETPAGLTLMCADVPPGMDHTPGTNVAVSLSGDDAEELRGYWAGLSDGAIVQTQLEVQMWGDEFGQLTDRFGVNWLVNIRGPENSPENSATDRATTDGAGGGESAARDTDGDTASDTDGAAEAHPS